MILWHRRLRLYWWPFSTVYRPFSDNSRLDGNVMETCVMKPFTVDIKKGHGGVKFSQSKNQLCLHVQRSLPPNFLGLRINCLIHNQNHGWNVQISRYLRTLLQNSVYSRWGSRQWLEDNRSYRVRLKAWSASGCSLSTRGACPWTENGQTGVIVNVQSSQLNFITHLPDELM